MFTEFLHANFIDHLPYDNSIERCAPLSPPAGPSLNIQPPRLALFTDRLNVSSLICSVDEILQHFSDADVLGQSSKDKFGNVSQCLPALLLSALPS